MNILLFLVHIFFVFTFTIYILFVTDIKILAGIGTVSIFVLLINVFYGDCPISIIEDKHGGPAFMDVIASMLFPEKYKYTKELRPLVTLELIYIGTFFILVKIMAIILLKYFKKNIKSILRSI